MFLEQIKNHGKSGGLYSMSGAAKSTYVNDKVKQK